MSEIEVPRFHPSAAERRAYRVRFAKWLMFDAVLLYVLWLKW